MTAPTRQRIRELSKEANRDRIHYAYLAEDYDGIGQYIKVALARSSVAGGMKARISSGDFATGQRMPAGTPVAVFSDHGRIVILSMGAK